MQIRLVIGVQDQRYLNRLVSYLEKNHMDKLEIFAFSETDMFRDFFSHDCGDVILVDEDFGLSAENLADDGKAAYLSGENGSAENGIRRIAKYKKPELIYKDILDLYAESGSHESVHPEDKRQHAARMVLVTGFSGGTGASTFAAALAKHYAFQGKKALYLNLETTGSSSDFFTGEGSSRFEDVIFALKSQRTDVRLKMESAMRRDSSGVSFFEPCTSAMYMLELKQEDIMKMMDALGEGIGCDCVVVDMNFQLSVEFMELMNRMDQVILVQDGSETSNSKFRRTLEAVRILEEQKQIHVISRMRLVYNRFSSSKSSGEISGLTIPVLGKIPPVKHAQVHEIVDYMLTRQEIFGAC